MKATPDDYKPRPMAQLCQEVLEILRDTHDPVRCGYIGGMLFPECIQRGSAPFARIAGKVTRKLGIAGLAEWKHDRSGFGGWVVTPAGKRCDYR